MKKQVKADVMLIFVTISWGTSYFLISLCLEAIEPLMLNAYRFLGAFVIASLFSFNKIKKVNKITLKYSLYIAIALYFTYIGATFGVKYTSLSNAGFLCSLTVVVTPFLNYIFRKIIPDRKLGMVLVLCIIGIGLMTLNEELKLAWGDILCIICAFAYAVDMIVTEVAVKKEEVNPYQVGMFQMLFTGIFFLVTSLITETQTLPNTKEIWISLIFLTVFSTGIAFIIQPIAQQYTTAVHVGVIFTLEPVFAGFVAYFLAGEILLPRAYFGAGLLLFSIFIMEVDLKKIFLRKNLK